MAVSLTQALLAGDISQSDYAWLGTLVALADDSVGDGAPFFWPLSSKFQPKKMVDQVGFHFFASLLRTMHSLLGDMNSPEVEIEVDPGERYEDELDLGAQIDELHGRVIRPLARQGFDLSWSLTAMCFPATYPDDPGEEDSWYPDTNPAYQAGIAARRICYVKARGDAPDVVLWYTAMAKITGAGESHSSWGKYTATGIRNDVVIPRDPPVSVVQEGRCAGVATGAFHSQEHAWRRPVWYTLRRLAWLWRRTKSASFIRHQESDRTVVLRLEAYDEALFRDPSADATLYGATVVGRATGGYKYAYIAWMDELAPEDAGESFTISLFYIGDGEVQILPLVPRVDYTQSDTGAMDEETRYPDFEAVEWTEELADSKIYDDGTGHLQIAVMRAGPDNPAPLCFLTDAASAGMQRVESSGDNAEKNTIASQREFGELEPQGSGQETNESHEVLGPKPG